MTYVLHYAPDNASLIILPALLELTVPFETRLVDRRIKEQSSKAFLKFNPNGSIPVLETGHDTLFKTGAILLWLADQHRALAPTIGQVERFIFDVANLAVKHAAPHVANAFLSRKVS